ncbi:hypothetical protein LWI29_024080 [Acer saccharum]|uniref:Disease resistance R13L4/SHOC-2-like LRR domain-containing protein n=1 Tax=Acer saccharum TaxID=4024 RepID=A0AA39SLL2_ACESA|nr:hypothetical protein LWI29_024080 [Acer saccharum]
MIDNSKVLRWRAALVRVANIVGDFISCGRSEATLVEDIVKDICGRLHISSFDGDQRLWLFEDVQQVLTSNTGTDKVIGIMLNKSNQRLQLNGNSFSNMSNLMLLKLSNADVSEDQIYLPNKLRFLKWQGFPLKTLPSNFEAENLFELNLCDSQINYLWKGMKEFPSLKTIKLRNSHNLIETPDFTRVPNLEMLDLKGCTRLCKVHKSVGVLKSLIVLNLEGCNSLQSFPSNVFSSLKSLKILNLQGCSKLHKFPENLEELEQLEELDVGGTAITQVPSSIARLTNLQKLSFQKCNSQRPWWSSCLSRTNTRCLALPSLAGNCYVFAFAPHSFTTFEYDHLWLAYVSLEQFEHERSLTLESSRRWEYEYDSINYVLVSTSTCIHARFYVRSPQVGYSKESKAIKSTGIRLIYKRDIECSEDDLPAPDASIHQHHNCSTFHGNRRRFCKTPITSSSDQVVFHLISHSLCLASVIGDQALFFFFFVVVTELSLTLGAIWLL